MKCTKHSEREAAGCCAYCGKPFCEDCLVEFKGRLFCKSDLEKVMEKYAEQQSRVNINKGDISSDDQKVNIVIHNENNNNNKIEGSPILAGNFKKHKFMPTFLFWFFGGGLGCHQFYVGKVGMGILYLMTLGLCGILPLIDIIMMFTDNFTDCNGNTLEVTSPNDKLIAAVITFCYYAFVFFFYLFSSL